LNTSGSSSNTTGGGIKTKISLHGNIKTKILYQSKCTLKSHFDSIRGLQFLNTHSYEGKTGVGHSLISASEDCTLKVWDAMKFCNYKELSVGDGHHNFEPYLTLRGHNSSIMTLAGSDSNPLLSGNQEGIIISGSEKG
jgi:WD40 repeat protein